MKKKLIIPVAVVATGAVVAKIIQKRRKNKSGSYRSSNVPNSPTRYAKKHSRRSARPSRGGA